MSLGQANPENAEHISVAPTIDCVYTWVDDQQPGYQQALADHSEVAVDRDPSRTRDNLETLRYSLRSLELYAPWVRNVYVFACRPQVPHWLETSHPRLKMIYHDEVIPSKYLPTFNSFSIISFLHLLPGLSENFIYFEDDMLLLRPSQVADFVGVDGKLKFYRDSHLTPIFAEVTSTRNPKPWNLALAESNRQLDEMFGHKRRFHKSHMPLLINKKLWASLQDIIPDVTEQTRTSKFRKAGNVPFEYFYPYYLFENGLAELMNKADSRAAAGYVPLEYFWPVTAFRLWQTKRNNPITLTLNDNFGSKPNPVTEKIIRTFLENKFQRPSSFERENFSIAAR